MISLIVAFCKDNHAIGLNGKIPWHIKEDLLHFKNYTQNNTVLMGDTTYFSLKSYYKDKPLPYGKIYVATINKSLKIEGVEMVYDLSSFLSSYNKTHQDELWICGGATIYRLSLPYVDKMIISEVKNHYEGDTFFPYFDDEFDLIYSEERQEFYINIYQRKANNL